METLKESLASAASELRLELADKMDRILEAEQRILQRMDDSDTNRTKIEDMLKKKLDHSETDRTKDAVKLEDFRTLLTKADERLIERLGDSDSALTKVEERLMAKLGDFETNRTRAEMMLMEKFDGLERNRSKAEERLMKKLNVSEKARQLLDKIRWKFLEKSMEELENKVENQTIDMETHLVESTGKLSKQLVQVGVSVGQLGSNVTRLEDRRERQLQKQLTKVTGQLGGQIVKTIQYTIRKGRNRTFKITLFYKRGVSHMDDDLYWTLSSAATKKVQGPPRAAGDSRVYPP